MRREILLIMAVFALMLPGPSCSGKVIDYRPVVLQTYSHDSKAYTQGLFFVGEQMYETTGEYGRSSLRKVDLETGVVRSKVSFASKYFAEGSCVVGSDLYVLTWKNKVAFVYDLESLTYRKTLSYPREGWGLASIPEDCLSKFPQGTAMVSSDGSSSLYFLDGELRTLKTIKVTLDGRPVRLLNELEWIDGKIWANVYTTDMIVIIDPFSGRVEGKIDCSDLIPYFRRTPAMDVLNGIALGPDSQIYLTGKNWPKMFRIRLE